MIFKKSLENLKICPLPPFKRAVLQLGCMDYNRAVLHVLTASSGSAGVFIRVSYMFSIRVCRQYSWWPISDPIDRDAFKTDWNQRDTCQRGSVNPVNHIRPHSLIPPPFQKEIIKMVNSLYRYIHCTCLLGIIMHSCAVILYSMK